MSKVRVEAGPPARRLARARASEMYTVPLARAWWLDVGPRLERGVRRHDACGGGPRRAYRVPYVCNADALDDGRATEDGWGVGEVVEESHAGAEKNRSDVNVNLVEESSV